MAAAYGSQAYGYTSSSSSRDHRYQSHYSSEDRSRYEYDNRDWKSSQQHSHGSYSSSAYSRPQSPNMDIKPPTWYQNYAHSVTPKTQPPPPSSYQDPYYYQRHGHHSSGGYSSNGYHASDHGAHDYDYRGEKIEGHHSKSKSGIQSVHPFDTDSKSSKSKKPKRIKNPGHDEDLIVMDDEFYSVKAKRKRANASQLSVLNAAFERSYFPSTEERLRLSKQCRMCPRTVQIWFQNKRQSVKAKSEAMEAAAAAGGTLPEGRRDSNEDDEEEDDDSSDGQKRSIDGDGDEDGLPSRRHNNGAGGNRRSTSNAMMPSEAVMSALHIQLDGRSVDYFSRKRRATIAKMEQNEQQKQQQQKQQGQSQNEESLDDNQEDMDES
ncbi:hypothetical protein BGZ76_005686 [Entomortierella beljakovae]|nr:hypothetical protein BGZ76_005686 [Entomortierella beljakovae]